MIQSMFYRLEVFSLINRPWSIFIVLWSFQSEFFAITLRWILICLIVFIYQVFRVSKWQLRLKVNFILKTLKAWWLANRKTWVLKLSLVYFWCIYNTWRSIFALKLNLALRKIRETSPALHTKIRRILFVWKYLFPICGIRLLILSWTSDVQVCTVSSIQFFVFLLWRHTHRSFHNVSRTLFCIINLLSMITLSYSINHLYALSLFN